MTRWIAVLVLALAGTVQAQDSAELKTQKEKLSYALGMNVGSNFKREGIEVDLDVFIRGLKDTLSGSSRLLADDEARTLITNLQQELRQKQLAQASEKNKAAGKAFLEKNKTAEGVVTLPSGLQYKILKAGEGKKPGLEDTVVCHYRGTLVNGTEFDSSYKRNQPATFPVKAVIKGWTEALQLMPIGSRWQLFIPSELGYGERGAAVIGPNETLIFEVELISIQ